MRNFVVLLVSLLLVSSCQSKTNTKENDISTRDKTSLNQAINIDLDTCSTVNVDFDNVFITHRNFDSVGEKDTLFIANNLISVKTSKYLVGEEEACLSQIEIFYNNERVFYKDSILTTGMYDYSLEKGLITIPLIISQNIDNLSTETFLYILNLKNFEVQEINETLINSSFSLICSSGGKILYNNSDKLISFDLLSSKKEVVFNFDNPIISIFKLDVKDDNLEIFYFKDFSNDIINEVPMKMSKFKLSYEICE